jgi:hypothetical protein
MTRCTQGDVSHTMSGPPLVMCCGVSGKYGQRRLVSQCCTVVDVQMSEIAKVKFHLLYCSDEFFQCLITSCNHASAAEGKTTAQGASCQTIT